MRVLSRLFRRLFLDQLQHAFTTGQLQFFATLAPLQDPQAFAAYLAPLRQTDWVVYAKRPLVALSYYTPPISSGIYRLLFGANSGNGSGNGCSTDAPRRERVASVCSGIIQGAPGQT